MDYTCKLLGIKAYHAVMREKYNNAVSKHEYGKGGFPYIGFFLFYDKQGNERQEGFVATDEQFNKACYAKTAKGAIGKFKNF